jgi:hypothetical protein
MSEQEKEREINILKEDMTRIRYRVQKWATEGFPGRGRNKGHVQYEGLDIPELAGFEEEEESPDKRQRRNKTRNLAECLYDNLTQLEKAEHELQPNAQQTEVLIIVGNKYKKRNDWEDVFGKYTQLPAAKGKYNAALKETQMTYEYIQSTLGLTGK